MRPPARPQEYGRGTTAADVSDRGHGHGHGPRIMVPGCGQEAKKVRPRARIFSSVLTPRPLLSQTHEHGSADANTAAGVRPRYKAADISDRGRWHGPRIMPQDADTRQKRCVLAHVFFYLI